jgi:predicted transposase/invertase (TIGR01784 family)
LRRRTYGTILVYRWLTWFSKDRPEMILEEVLKMDTAIRKVEGQLVYVSGDKGALRAYQMREMALSDWASGINHARREGQRAIARNLKKIGIPVEQMVQGTGLSIEDIQNYKL